jgi:hypothetical protein
MTPTVGNVVATGKARAALDSADDVVIIAADASASPFGAAPTHLVDLYVSRTGWDPRANPGEWSLVALEPRLIHVWNSFSEIEGRTVMRNGIWVDT